MRARRILICGPPGAGKSTLAASYALPVFDIDADPWAGDERAFSRSLRQLAQQPNSPAVVIRSGATLAARQRWQRLLGITETIVMLTPADVCQQRVRQRNRKRPPMRQQTAAVADWFRRYEPEPRRSWVD